MSVALEQKPGESKSGNLPRHICLGAGGVVENSFQNTPLVLANPIYNVGLGVNPVLIGVAMALPRVWEILIDPFIGVLSDRTRSRWGRRVPYMAGGLIAALVLFVALWWPPIAMSVTAHGIWLIAAAFLFYTAYSFYAIPYAAFTIDASVEGPDRIGLMTSRAAFSNLSSIVINWLYWVCQWDCFGGPVQGVRWVGLGFGIFVAVCGILPVLYWLRQGGRPAIAAGTVEAASHAPPRGILKKVLRLRPLQCLLVALLSTTLGFTLVGHLGFYLTGFYVCGGDLKRGAFIGGVKSTIVLVSAVAVCPLLGYLAKRLGKEVVLKGLLLIGMIACLGQWFLITPVSPYRSLASDLGIAVCLAGFWMLMPAFLGDVCDHYERLTGDSCQGTLSAVYGIAVKIGASLALLTTGYVLVVCGFHADMPQVQMDSPLWNMRVFYAVVPAVGMAISFLAMSWFRIPPSHSSAR